MIIDSIKWEAYFGPSIPFPDSERLEMLAISLFDSIFPNILDYADIETAECILNYEYALMEQMLHYENNEYLKDGIVATGGSFTLGKWRQDQNKDNDITAMNQTKRLNTNAYNYIVKCGWAYMGVDYHATSYTY